MAKDTKHRTITTFEIKLVEPGDIPAITELWYNAFSIPQNLKMFPDTPGVRQWWDEAHRQDILHNPHRRYLKVVDIASPCFMVAYAKWDLNPQQSGRRFPPWHEESDHQAGDELFGMLEKERNKFFGEKQFYYLDMLVTHPDYRRQGAGSMLIQWGCDRADGEGVPAYVDAHHAAAPLYRKFGFRDRTDVQVDLQGALPMVREYN
ncbi:hypothetical protein Aspvir_001768 [Aspergillus viridinutans]|uniref:N-acetyltransferase domain-containing protein n=1 Tax=Aspergillus viridinutans TaxID=75553 RepID=A0A9P3BZW2_ASPVI|nr:uncharacterized protein Aspvir_001768 [Aspergillus viridinutans]GIK06125.1 hypothetical protein Aspvir_001768 [Aspergillus viridinutans]